MPEFIELEERFYSVFNYNMKSVYNFPDNPNPRQKAMVFVTLFLQNPREANLPQEDVQR